MFKLKYLQAQLKKINYILMDIWKELFQIDSKWMHNDKIKEHYIYKRFKMYENKKILIKQLYVIELELYNLNQLNTILLKNNQNMVADVINLYYIYSLENIKKELNKNLKI